MISIHRRDRAQFTSFNYKTDGTTYCIRFNTKELIKGPSLVSYFHLNREIQFLMNSQPLRVVYSVEDKGPFNEISKIGI